MNAQACYARLITPNSTAAIAVIELTGRDSLHVINHIFKRSKQSRVNPNEIGSLLYGELYDNDEQIDDIVLSYISSVENIHVFHINLHGGLAIVKKALVVLNKHGVHIRESSNLPDQDKSGIFESKSIENDCDHLILSAKTSRAVKFLTYQRANLTNQLKKIVDMYKSSDKESAKDHLNKLIEIGQIAIHLINGVRITLTGLPNSGKSTLFNLLLGEKRALVHDKAGTTRDWISSNIDLEGLPVELIDTAGVREIEDSLETKAIDSGQEITSKSDLVLHVIDISVFESVSDLINTLKHVNREYKDQRLLIILNKIDRIRIIEEISFEFDESFHPVIFLSAREGSGKQDLIRQILTKFGCHNDFDSVPGFFTDIHLTVAKKILSGNDPSETFSDQIQKRLIDSKGKNR